MPTLVHVVSLQQAAGVETHFTEFIEHARRRHPAWSHVLLNRERGVHPHFEKALAAHLERTVYAKYRWGLKLPSRPKRLRAWHCRRELRSADAGLALIWNRTERVGAVLDAMGERRCIHWEHGAIWHAGRERERRQYLERVPLAIANSRASARMLQLLCDYRGAIRVCRNALRPSLSPAATAAKRFPAGRPLRLGVAARLRPVKGIPSALHAVMRLRERSVEAELHVAGAGSERAALERLAGDLGIGDRVHFRGSLDDMPAFYSQIDCLLHPPLTEAFGLVAIEAAASGCPVIAAGVDGLAEAVEPGVTGHLIAPTLTLDQYRALGSSLEDVPERVYDPAGDRLTAPKAVDPEALAAAVARLFADAGAYERLSRTASEHVRRQFGFDAHVDAVMEVIGEYRAESSRR